MTTVLFSHAWQRSSPPSLFPDLIVAPRIFKISFQSRKKTPHIFSWPLSECRKMFPRKSGFQDPHTNNSHVLVLVLIPPPLDHPDFLMIVLMFLVWCSFPHSFYIFLQNDVGFQSIDFPFLFSQAKTV